MASACAICSSNSSVFGPPKHKSIPGAGREDAECRWPSAEQQQKQLHRLYKPLRSGQIRLLRLNPHRNGRLSADLVTANLRPGGGASLDEDLSFVAYEALSYAWGLPEKTHVIDCNGVLVPITENLATILHCVSKRKLTYLWVDALCIFQDDTQEKSAQVLNMLRIFVGAESVIAWLGIVDMDGLLAFSHIVNQISLEKQLGSLATRRCRSTRCEAKLRAIYGTLTRFCDRPWFKRMWIRSEIFAARSITMMIGSFEESTNRYIYQSMKSFNFVQLQILINNVKWCRSDIQMTTPPSVALLEDIVQLLRLPEGGVKTPKSFSDLLLRSKDLEATQEVDVVYSILGICAVPARDTQPYDSSPDAADASITVDYSKSIEKVLEEASIYILDKKNDGRDLANLWNFVESYPDSPRASPKWVVDWRSSRCSRNDMDKINLLVNVATLGKCPWLPLSSRYLKDGESSEANWPVVKRGSPIALNVQARVLNYVAYLSAYTCDVDAFLSKDDGGFVIGSKGQAIHAKYSEKKTDKYFNGMPVPPVYFDSTRRSRRIAILGVADDEQVALVPAHAKKGDLVVAISPHVLPLVFSPVNRRVASSGLFPDDDVSDVTFSRRLRQTRTCLRAIWRKLSCLMVAVWFSPWILMTVGLARHWSAEVTVALFFGQYAMIFVALIVLSISKMFTNTANINEAIRRRRTDVRAYLDKAVIHLGSDYEFVGPLFVRHRNASGEAWSRPVQDMVLH